MLAFGNALSKRRIDYSQGSPRISSILTGNKITSVCCSGHLAFTKVSDLKEASLSDVTFLADSMWAQFENTEGN